MMHDDRAQISEDIGNPNIAVWHTNYAFEDENEMGEISE